MLQNRRVYAGAPNGDMWREVYARMDALEVKPTIHKKKSHTKAAEFASHGIQAQK